MADLEGRGLVGGGGWGDVGGGGGEGMSVGLTQDCPAPKE